MLSEGVGQAILPEDRAANCSEKIVSFVICSFDRGVSLTFDAKIARGFTSIPNDSPHGLQSRYARRACLLWQLLCARHGSEPSHLCERFGRQRESALRPRQSALSVKPRLGAVRFKGLLRALQHVETQQAKGYLIYQHLLKRRRILISQSCRARPTPPSGVGRLSSCKAVLGRKVRTSALYAINYCG